MYRAIYQLLLDKHTIEFALNSSAIPLRNITLTINSFNCKAKKNTKSN
jgi:hypothetical protein